MPKVTVPPKVQSNRRSHPRYPVRRAFRVARINAMYEEIFAAEVLEAAPLGMRLQMEEPVIPGEMLRLESTDAQGPALVVTAEVQWVSFDVDGWRVGLELRRELSREELRALRG